MLPLDSDKWSQLSHAYGAAEDVPQMLRDLARESTDEGWERIWSSLCHQGSVYPAAFATVPHIVSLAKNQPFKDQLRSLDFVATVVTEGVRRNCEPPEDLGEAYRHSLVKAAPLVYKALVSKPEDESDVLYLLSALAAVRGCIGPAYVLDLLAGGEALLACPGCDQDLYVVAREDGVFVAREDPEGHPDPNRFWMKPAEEKSLNAPINLEDFRLENCKDWLSQTACEAGYPRVGESIRALYSQANCPACDKPFDLLKAFSAEAEGKQFWE